MDPPAFVFLFGLPSFPSGRGRSNGPITAFEAHGWQDLSRGVGEIEAATRTVSPRRAWAVRPSEFKRAVYPIGGTSGVHGLIDIGLWCVPILPLVPFAPQRSNAGSRRVPTFPTAEAQARHRISVTQRLPAVTVGSWLVPCRRRAGDCTGPRAVTSTISPGSCGAHYRARPLRAASNAACSSASSKRRNSTRGVPAASLTAQVGEGVR